MNKKEIKNIIELFIAWNGETEAIDVANIDSAVEFIDSSLQEEPVSDDFENAALEYATYYDKNWSEVKDGYIAENEVEAFKAGTQWHKEQIMKEAIDAEVLQNYDGNVIKYDETILDEKLSDCKVFDKVKLIVLKEN